MIDQEERPQAPMTESGLECLIKCLGNGLILAFSRAEINIPLGYMFDEIEITDNIVRASGTITLDIRKDASYDLLEVNFSGEGALVKSIFSPLDLDGALSSGKHNDQSPIINVQLGRHPKIVGDRLLGDSNYGFLKRRFH